MDGYEKLMEQYDEAAFALMMDRSAEEEGAELLRSFREVSDAGALLEYSDALDRRCRDSIEREFGKRTRRVRFRRFGHSLARAAVVAFAMIGLAGTLILSVDAIRIPVMNFFIEYRERFAEISTDGKKEEYGKEDVYNLLADILPEDYVLEEMDDDWPKVGSYTNSDGELIRLTVADPAMELSIDTEDAVCYEVILSDYKALMIEKYGYVVFWVDDEGMQYNFYASALTKSQVMEICSALAMVNN